MSPQSIAERLVGQDAGLLKHATEKLRKTLYASYGLRLEWDEVENEIVLQAMTCSPYDESKGSFSTWFMSSPVMAAYRSLMDRSGIRRSRTNDGKVRRDRPMDLSAIPIMSREPRPDQVVEGKEYYETVIVRMAGNEADDVVEDFRRYCEMHYLPSRHALRSVGGKRKGQIDRRIMDAKELNQSGRFAPRLKRVGKYQNLRRRIADRYAPEIANPESGVTGARRG